jgi:hypothetical protein
MLDTQGRARNVRQIIAGDDPAYTVDDGPPLLALWCFPLQIVVFFAVRFLVVFVVGLDRTERCDFFVGREKCVVVCLTSGGQRIVRSLDIRIVLTSSRLNGGKMGVEGGLQPGDRRADLIWRGGDLNVVGHG